MRDEMKEAGLPAPKFTADGGFFTVTFKRPKKNDPVNVPVKQDYDPVNDPVKQDDDPVKQDDDPVNDPVNLEELVFKLICDKEGLSAPEISALIGKSLKTTKRYITKLREAGKIEFVGAPKTGGYYLKK